MKTLIVGTIVFILSFIVFNAATNGWFYYYTFYVTSIHKLSLFRIEFVLQDIALSFFYYLFLFYISWNNRKKLDSFLVLTVGVSFFVAIGGRLNHGGMQNVYIPFFVFSLFYIAHLFQAHKSTFVSRILFISVLFIQIIYLISGLAFFIPDYSKIELFEEKMKTI